MGDLDPTSRLLGNIESSLQALKEGQESQGEKIDCVEIKLSEKIDCLDRKLTNARIKTAWLAGGVAVMTTLLTLLLSGWAKH